MAHKILLADDSITIQKVVNLTFTDEGIDVVTVGNGELALKKLREDVYDLVLADIFMPGRNGYEVCEYIKSQPELSRVPVILLVGAFEPFDRSEASRVRADGHLTKPFESRILVETVKRMLAQVQPRPAERPVAPSAPDWGAPPAGVMAGGQGEPASYDPYASTVKMSPFGAEADGVPDEQTQVIGSPFSPPLHEPDGEARFGQAAGDVFQFNLSGPLPVVSPSEDAPSADYTTQPHEPLEQQAEYDEEPAASPGTLAFGESSETPSWEAPTVISASGGQTADFGAVETHTYEAEYVEERRDPLLESFDDVARETANVDAAADPELVVNAQAEGESSLQVGPVEGLTTSWSTEAIPAGFQSESEAADESGAAEESGDAEEFSARTHSYSPAMRRPFDAAETAAEPEAPEAPVAYNANRTQAYRFDLAPFTSAEQEEADLVAAGAGPEEAAALEAEAEAPAAEEMAELPIEIVDTPEMPETAPPPPASLPAANFNFDPTRTQQYEFGLPPFEQDEEAEEVEATAAGTGTGDLDFTPPPPPISDEPLEAAFADTAPLQLSTLAAAEQEMGLAEEPAGEPALAIEGMTSVAEEEPVAHEEASVTPAAEEEAEAVEAAPEPVETEAVLEPAESVEEPAEPAEAAPVFAVAETAAANGSGDHVAPGADLLAVPSDIIDEIVRRTVERMSDDVIREIAWEVVPDLAARMIKKHLEEGR
jgi:CheY-like chemotaxis protein